VAPRALITSAMRPGALMVNPFSILEGLDGFLGYELAGPISVHPEDMQLIPFLEPELIEEIVHDLVRNPRGGITQGQFRRFGGWKPARGVFNVREADVRDSCFQSLGNRRRLEQGASREIIDLDSASCPFFEFKVELLAGLGLSRWRREIVGEFELDDLRLRKERFVVGIR
jgi:hypothetical protein